MASSSTTRFRPSLPTELWSRIFQIAVGGPLEIPSKYIPFEQTQSLAFLSVKRAITLVCRMWRAVGLEFLYEDIIVGECSVYGLIEGLERVEPFAKEKNGRFVRRVTLSSTRIDDDVAVLKCCPNVEIVVKPSPKTNIDASQIQNPFPDPTLSFPSLKRIEWSVAKESDSFVQESVSLLWHILQITPSVCDLSLACCPPRPSIWLPSSLFGSWLLVDLSEHLAQLQVLRIRGLGFTSRQPRVRRPLSNLTHLITDRESIFRNLDRWVDPAMISVVELVEGFNTYQVIAEDIIHRILLLCPQLRELNYCFAYMPPRIVPDEKTHIHSHLECVRLQIDRFYDGYHPHSIGEHLSVFCSPIMFPSLQRMVIRGCHDALKRQIMKRWMPDFTKRNAVLEAVP